MFINGTNFLKQHIVSLALVSTLFITLQSIQASDSRFPYCASPASDSDGNGYGWENDATCLVNNDSGSYTVTVRNLTYNQVLSPVLAATHSNDVALLNAGRVAGAGLTAFAESGNTSILQSELRRVSAVTDVATSGGPIPPANEVTFNIDGAAAYISVVAMLVNTNDALMVVDTAALPEHSGDSIKVHARSYDAGTETNDEMCSHIPGPACGGAGASPDDDGEGFVHIHRGLQRIGDLDSAAHAWTDPVAVITIRRN